MQALFDFYIYSIESFFELFTYDYRIYLAILKPISFLLSLVFGFFIIYSVVKFRQIMKSIKGISSSSVLAAATKSPEMQKKAFENWQKILEKGRSLDENERKFALIEADSMLDKILGLAGYTGENLGAKLKQVERGDIESLDDLWEAHKIRNRIAHEAGFKLTAESAVLALSRFEKALKELQYI
ncbi:MAG: hypothetical protein AAB522_03160 [Patescibacteria group bacterium]